MFVIIFFLKYHIFFYDREKKMYSVLCQVITRKTNLYTLEFVDCEIQSHLLSIDDQESDCLIKLNRLRFIPILEYLSSTDIIFLDFNAVHLEFLDKFDGDHYSLKDFLIFIMSITKRVSDLHCYRVALCRRLVDYGVITPGDFLDFSIASSNNLCVCCDFITNMCSAHGFDFMRDANIFNDFL